MLSLEIIESKVLEIQLKYFKRTPEQTGTCFYALELVGEIGEFLNIIKKNFRTSCEKKKEMYKEEISEEIADIVISAIMLKLSLSREFSNLEIYVKNKYDNINDIQKKFAKICCQTSNWYFNCVNNEMIYSDFILQYHKLIENIATIALFFNIDLITAINLKLDKIILRVQRGDYD